MTNVFVQSGYERIEGDNYQTVDPRCVNALVKVFPHILDLKVVDMCADQGSGIVTRLRELYVNAEGWDNAFSDEKINANWGITNPPYQRKLVDDIIWRQLQRIDEGEMGALAVLLRSTFDHAKGRVKLFRDNPLYRGQVRLLFRPLWFAEVKAQPIHNYVWHIFWNERIPAHQAQRVWYADGILDEKFDPGTLLGVELE